ncbi:hypothetical protein [Paractinoplanes atraurantiacus]|nr:hypothetical protein [Actinoplanes atraurantiacus]
MAPERFEAHEPAVGPAADIFAWGVLITYAGTGSTPFAADSPAATAARILTQPPALGRLPSPLREIVARTLAKDPSDRPTAAQLLDLLLDTGSHGAAELTGHPDLRQAAENAQARDPRPRDPQARNPQTRDPQARDAQARDAQARDAQARDARVQGARRVGRRRVLATLVAAVAALGGAGAWIAADSPERGPDASGPVTSLKPAGSGKPAPTVRQAEGRVLISDRLDRPGRWEAAEDELGTCSFAGGRMVVTAGAGGANSCPGPEDRVAGDQSVAVTATLLEPRSCAWIGFRRLSDALGYNLFLCPDRVTLSVDAGDTRNTVTTVRSAIFTGGDHRIELRLEKGVATFSVDGVRLGTGPVGDRRLLTGRIELGLEIDGRGERGSVAFRDVEIRKL